MSDTRYRTEPISTPDNWKALEHHPSAEVERMMTDFELRELGDSILDRYDPARPIVLILCDDGQLRVLDGRNRKKVCAALDDAGKLIAPPPFDLFKGTALPVEYKSYALRLNESQKKLTEREVIERAMCIKERHEIENRERMKTVLRENAVKGGIASGESRSGTLSPDPGDKVQFPEAPKPKRREDYSHAIKHASEASGKGKNVIDELARLKRFAPDLYEAVLSDQMKRAKAIAELHARALKSIADTGKGLPRVDGSTGHFFTPSVAKKSAATEGEANGASSTEGTDTSSPEQIQAPGLGIPSKMKPYAYLCETMEPTPSDQALLNNRDRQVILGNRPSHAAEKVADHWNTDGYTDFIFALGRLANDKTRREVITYYSKLIDKTTEEPTR
jgi:hypothetical protein